MGDNMKNIYLCGPTVYNHVHIGNVRPILTMDIYIRALKSKNEEINFVHNITDIDDKIVEKALEEKKTVKEVSDFYTEKYLSVLKDFNIDLPNSMPRVLDHLQGIKEFIKRIIDTKAAYTTASGDVLFSVKEFKSYGSVSNREVDKLIINDIENKKYGGDFSLWKNTSIGENFSSEWSKGRPGWHTECSYFIEHYFKQQIDLHGGGVDLKFPHHENENAQYMALHNVPITKKWIHFGHLEVNDEKMSKSLGNSWYAKDFIEEYDADILRYIYLKSNPKSPFSINEKIINESSSKVKTMKKIFFKLYVELLNEKNKSFKPCDIVVENILEWKFSDALKQLNALIKLYHNEELTFSDKFILFNTFKVLGFKFSSVDPLKEDVQNYKEWKILSEDGRYKESDLFRDQLIKKGYL